MSERNSYCFLIVTGEPYKNSKELPIFDFILVAVVGGIIADSLLYVAIFRQICFFEYNS
jgi:hypothetical protein